MHLPPSFAFANDAQIAAVFAAVFLLLAVLARYAEGRRIRRARIDRVGWIPWTSMFLICSVLGLTLLALAAKGLFEA